MQTVKPIDPILSLLPPYSATIVSPYSSTCVNFSELALNCCQAFS